MKHNLNPKVIATGLFNVADQNDDLNNKNVMEAKLPANSSSDPLINPSTQTSNLMADINQNTEVISTTMQGLAPQEASDTQMPLTIQLSAQGSNADTLLNQNETFLS